MLSPRDVQLEAKLWLGDDCNCRDWLVVELRPDRGLGDRANIGLSMGLLGLSQPSSRAVLRQRQAGLERTGLWQMAWACCEISSSIRGKDA